MKINLSEYPTAGKIAARAVARAAANDTDTIFSTNDGAPLNQRSFIRQGRRSWVEFWRDRLARNRR